MRADLARTEINSVRHLIRSVLEVVNDQINFVRLIVEGLTDLSLERERVQREYAVDQDFGFNFFTSISDFHRRETFHSDVLALILNPSTDVLGDAARVCLRRLFRAVEVASADRVRIEIDPDGPIFVEKEVGNVTTGRIDILIHDGSHAVIVENKMNDAVDQPDQLARYLRYCKTRPDGALVVDAIVYLPRVMKAPSHQYSAAYRDLADEVRKLTVVLPAVGRRTTGETPAQTDLAHDVLAECVTLLENPHKSTASVYMEQYTALVKHIGGNTVSEEIDKSILRELLATEDSIRAAKTISEVWGKQKNLVPQILFDLLARKNGIRTHPDNADVLIYDDSPDVADKGHVVAFEYLAVGFWSGSSGALARKAELREVLASVDFGSGFSEIEELPEWVWRELDVAAVSEPIDALVDRVHGILRNLWEADRNRDQNG